MRLAGLTLFLLAMIGAPACAAQSYKPAGAVALGAPDRWDYAVFDPGSGRVYVAHGDRVTVVDGGKGTIVGNVTGIPGGTHGTAISAATGTGFTDDSKAGTVIPFDLTTLKTGAPIPARADADAMVFDAASGHVFAIEGDPASITVVDPRAATVIATIEVGEKLEYAAADDRGALFVAGEERGDLVRIDTATNRVTAHWPAADCKSPHGLAIDRARNRVFVGCVNAEMIVMDGATGRVLDKLAIGQGNDAVAFDPKRHRVFSSNGRDGTISVYEDGGKAYRALPVIATKVSGRTMTLDPVSGRLFVPAADLDPPTAPGVRPKAKPGSLQLLMFDPVER